MNSKISLFLVHLQKNILIYFIYFTLAPDYISSQCMVTIMNIMKPFYLTFDALGMP